MEPSLLRVQLSEPAFKQPASLRIYLAAIPPMGSPVALGVRHSTVSHLVNDSREPLAFAPKFESFDLRAARNVPLEWAVALLIEFRWHVCSENAEYVGVALVKGAGKKWDLRLCEKKRVLVTFGCPKSAYSAPAPGLDVSLFPGLGNLLSSAGRGGASHARGHSGFGSLVRWHCGVEGLIRDGANANAVSCFLEMELISHTAVRCHSTCAFKEEDMPRACTLRTFAGLVPDDANATIVRTDYVCPICFVNCWRERTFASHAATEHGEYRISCEALVLKSGGEDDGFGSLRERTVHAFSAERRDIANTGATKPVLSSFPGSCEVVYASRSRFPQWDNTEVAWKVSLQSLLGACEIGNARGQQSAMDVREVSGENEYDQKSSGSDGYESDTDFDVDEFEKEHSPQFSLDDLHWKEFLPPLAPLARPDAKGRAEKMLAEAVSSLKLYHVVSLERVKVSHLAGNGYDSEEDGDNSWRLQIAEDDLRALRRVDPKHRALWALWNRFAFAQCAAGKFGDRYTRYSLELFALMCSSELRRLGLRVQFLAFCRSLHVHGCVDASGVISAFQCLDGDKTLAQCRESALPKGDMIGDDGLSMRRHPVGGKEKKRKPVLRSGKGKGRQ